MSKKAVHFGAGNIGRGFIGLVLTQSGYHVTFVDVNEAIIQQLKAKKEYTVEFLSEQGDVTLVTNVDGLSSIDEAEKVLLAITEADLITTAVGPAILPVIAKTIAQGLKARIANQVSKPLHVIACENMIGATSELKQSVLALLDIELIQTVEKQVGFLDAAVDRIVPIQHNQDILKVMVEPFYEWVIDTTNSKSDVDISGIIYTTNMAAYIERKLFTVNTSHSAIAYIGYYLKAKTIDEALAIPKVKQLATSVLAETSAYLVKQHGFDALQMQAYVEKTLMRLSNKRLQDDVIRVARAPMRKLSNQDRFIKPLIECVKHNIPTPGLITTIAYALLFDEASDEQAIQLQESIQTIGLKATLLKVSGLADDHPSVEAIIAKANQLKENKLNSR